MTLKELLDKKRAVHGRRLLVKTTSALPTLKEFKVKEVSGSKEYVNFETYFASGWQLVSDFDNENKIIEILKG